MAQKINAKLSDPENIITPDVRAHVEATASKMVGHAALRREDFEDLCQSMYLEILQNVPVYDPDKSSFYTFACQVVKCWRSDFFTKRIAMGRDVPDMPFENPDTNEPSQYEIETAECSVDDYFRRQDIWLIVNSLPTIPRLVCLNFMDGLSSRAICKKMRINRHLMHDHIIPYLRDKFKKENF